METIYLDRDNLSVWQKKAKPSVMVLGFFDGIHKGHLEVIKTAAQIAKRKKLSLSVMSFSPHPKTILSNGKLKVHYLMPLSEKEEIFRKLGVNTFYTVEFTKEFASLLPEHFAVKYLVNLGVVHAVAGFDFSYGYKSCGTMDRLKNDSGGLIDVTKVEKIELHGEKISSTLIREKLLKGNVEELPELLGRPYTVECYWNGDSIKLHPYYTLPAPGCYQVTLNNKNGSMETKIMVLKNPDGLSLKWITGIPEFLEGRLSIVWHRRIQEDKVFGWSQFLPFRSFSYQAHKQ